MSGASNTGRVLSDVDSIQVSQSTCNRISSHVPNISDSYFSNNILLLNPLWKVEQFNGKYGEVRQVINEYGYPVLWDLTHPILNTRVSLFYAPITNISKKYDLSLFETYLLVKSNRFKEHTLKLRSISDMNENRAYKRTHFHNVTFSGLFKTRSDKDIIHHSNLIAIDLDYLNEKLQSVKETVNSMEETVLSFISPNGNGLKVVFRMNPLTHSQEQYYNTISLKLMKVCGLDTKHLDRSGKNVSRGCFLPHDPNAFLNSNLLPS